MTETILVPATAPGGETVVVPLVDLDGTARTDPELPDLTTALKSINDVGSAFRESVSATAAPDKTTIEFSIGFAMHGGKINAVFLDNKAEGSVAVTMQWGHDQK